MGKRVIGFGHFFALKSSIVYLNGNFTVIWTSALSKAAKRWVISAICCELKVNRCRFKVQVEGTIFASFVSLPKK